MEMERLLHIHVCVTCKNHFCLNGFQKLSTRPFSAQFNKMRLFPFFFSEKFNLSCSANHSKACHFSFSLCLSIVVFLYTAKCSWTLLQRSFCSKKGCPPPPTKKRKEQRKKQGFTIFDRNLRSCCFANNGCKHNWLFFRFFPAKKSRKQSYYKFWFTLEKKKSILTSSPVHHL